jgi:UDP-N-acetylmuramate--alanine ligase
MSLVDANDTRPVHFMGIGGAGMSALAELLTRRGVRVTGCDIAPEGAADLSRHNIPVVRGHDPEHLDGVRAVVVTSAVPRDHPELQRAQAAGIPVVRRAEALGEAVAGGTLIAIAGTHGKTTTTVMTTEALAAAGAAPTGLAGGRVAAWQGNLRAGSPSLFVVEADEYDRSFLALLPDIAVITNVESDHLDIYADLADIQRTFEQFLAPASTVVMCADDAGASSLTIPASSEALSYGIANPAARLAAHEILSVEGRLRFRILLDGIDQGELALQVPGVHNVRNALAAVACGLAMGHTLEMMRGGLEAFEGVERRFQRLGAVRGVQVVDDYAHHPTEIIATLDAARAAFPGRRLIAAFQPHLFTRTRDFADAFGVALARADIVFLTEIYPAREQPLPGITSALVAEALRKAGRQATWMGERSALAQVLATIAREGDVVLTLGAGDITHTATELLQRLGDSRPS